MITVADDGPGMEPEEAEHVFERFYRSDPSRSRTHGGAGLGLSIVGAIVTAHGGTVGARGAAGHGATFIVHLPTPAGEAVPPTDEPDGSPGTGQRADLRAGPEASDGPETPIAPPPDNGPPPDRGKFSHEHHSPLSSHVESDSPE